MGYSHSLLAEVKRQGILIHFSMCIIIIHCAIQSWCDNTGIQEAEEHDAGGAV